MKMRSVTPMRIAKTGYIIISAVFCIAGILFIARPELSVKIIGRGLGIAMILFGCIRLVGYFSRDLFRLAFQYDLEFGILLIALGIAILADGLFKVQIAMDSKRFGIAAWWLILLLAVLTGFVGLLLVFRPVESAHVLTMLLGVSLLAEGILNLCVVVSTVKIVKHQRPDVIESEFREIQ